MSDSRTPVVSRAPNLPLIWIVPLVAVAVAGWMVFREFRNRGPEVTIHFPHGNGVKAGQTTLEYQGVLVGAVTHVDLKEDLSGVEVTLRLDRNAAGLAREGSQFWVVRPEIGLSGIRGIDTLFTGARLNVRPGSGAPATEFKGLENPPPLENVDEGRAFVLHARQLGSLSPGAPVYYREVKVGTVENSQLAPDAASVLVRIRVKTPYVNLVRLDTHFWNAGGVSFRMSLLGAEVKATSLESLLTGGVSFATPESDSTLADVAPEGTIFELHSEMNKAWLEWRPRIPITPPHEAPETAVPGGPLAPRIKS